MSWQEQVYQKSKFDREAQEYWKRIREFVIERDGLRCMACLKRKKKSILTVHHIIPRMDGGTEDPDNLISLCPDCHNYVEEMGYRSKYDIKGCTSYIETEEDIKARERDHDKFMDAIDSNRPDWHARVYGGIKGHGNGKPQKKKKGKRK